MQKFKRTIETEGYDRNNVHWQSIKLVLIRKQSKPDFLSVHMIETPK